MKSLLKFTKIIQSYTTNYIKYLTEYVIIFKKKENSMNVSFLGLSTTPSEGLYSSKKYQFPSESDIHMYLEKHPINEGYLKEKKILRLAAKTFAKKSMQETSILFTCSSLISDPNTISAGLKASRLTYALIDCANGKKIEASLPKSKENQPVLHKTLNKYYGSVPDEYNEVSMEDEQKEK